MGGDEPAEGERTLQAAILPPGHTTTSSTLSEYCLPGGGGHAAPRPLATNISSIYSPPARDILPLYFLVLNISTIYSPPTRNILPVNCLVLNICTIISPY